MNHYNISSAVFIFCNNKTINNKLLIIFNKICNNYNSTNTMNPQGIHEWLTAVSLDFCSFVIRKRINIIYTPYRSILNSVLWPKIKTSKGRKKSLLRIYTIIFLNGICFMRKIIVIFYFLVVKYYYGIHFLTSIYINIQGFIQYYYFRFIPKHITFTVIK